MKIISWNVNGIRAIIKKGFYEFINEKNPDIICIQETKASPEQVKLKLPNYKYQFWNAAIKKGYSGTAIFSKVKPINISYDMNIEKHDQEGRIITMELEDFYLVNVYTPNSKRGLERLDYRYKEWDKDFLIFLKKLEEKKPVIFCGDLNVAHEEIDLARPKSNNKNAGFTKQERTSFTNYINANFIDTFRIFNQEPHHYTWWSYMFNARKNNIGWRIDYFCASKILKSKIKSSIILSEILGSDHAPILLTTK